MHALWDQRPKKIAPYVHLASKFYRAYVCIARIRGRHQCLHLQDRNRELSQQVLGCRHDRDHGGHACYPTSHLASKYVLGIKHLRTKPPTIAYRWMTLLRSWTGDRRRVRRP